jgi:hypothetical protein
MDFHLHKQVNTAFDSSLISTILATGETTARTNHTVLPVTVHKMTNQDALHHS